MSSNVFASNVWYSGNVTVAGTTSLSGTRTVQAFPPAAMTGYLTTLSGSYGVGNYVASASSEYGVGTNPAWYAFDKSGTLWTSNLGYNSTTGAYNAANVTVATTGTAYFGEWLQLQQPVSTVLSTYSILDRGDVTYESPNTFYVLGSRDGTNWTLVDSQSGITWSANQTRSFTVSTTQAFNYYRLVTNIINVSGGTPTRVSVGEWVLNGSIQGAAFTADGRLGLGVTNPTQALEVAGSAVVAGTLSAGNPLMFRNRIINGDFRIDQRGGGGAVTPAGYGQYYLDRWNIYNGTIGNCTVQQVSDAPVPSPFVNSLSVTKNSTSGEIWLIHVIEGYNIADFQMGTTNAQGFTVSFWVKCTTSGAVSLTFNNNNKTYYSTSFNVGSASAWQYITITVPPCTNGSWNNTSSGGIWMYINLGITNSFNTSIVNAWTTDASTTFKQTSGLTALPNGAVFKITGVQLEKGSVATPFEVVPYGTQLALCQRYYQTVLQAALYRRYMSNIDRQPITFPPMRAAPTGTPAALGTPTNLASISFTSYGVMSGYLDVGYTAGGTGVVDIPSGVNLNLSSEL